jgi:AbrB family looped-hinge helix DNA binding protein
MATYRVNVNGRVTIPKELREAMGLQPGDVMQFAREGNRLFITREPASSADSTSGRRLREALDPSCNE